MRILLTGGSGFVGSFVLPELVRAGHEVRCLARSPDGSLAGPGITETPGDVTEPSTLGQAATGCDAVVHLVGILEEKPSRGVTFERVHAEGTRNLVEAARAAGVRRFVHMSANGARPDGVSAYQTTKWAAEEHVRAAGFDRWTIFRPSLIFGDPGADHPEFCSRLARTLVGPFPVLPVFGDGRYRMSPVAAEDVAAAFVQALDRPEAARRSFCLAGDRSLTYDEILDVIARGMGIEPKPKVHQPIWLSRPIVQTVGRVGLLPITPDQFEMLIEGNACDPTELESVFDLPRIPFEPDRLAYLRESSSR